MYGQSPGYWGTIWCAFSTDGGYSWTEVGEVLGKGEKGMRRAEDHGSVFVIFCPLILTKDENDPKYVWYGNIECFKEEAETIFENVLLADDGKEFNF